jgi:hypothetical protein
MNTVEIQSPVDFFRDQVTNAAQSLQLRLNDDIEFYLVNLLCEFINPAQLNIDEDMAVLDTPLAFMLKKAIESTPDIQIKVYKRLGDTSLYFAGYFQDYFARKSFDVSYYINMGAAAYNQTSTLMRTHKNDRHFSQVYLSMAQDFRSLVNLVAEVSESTPLARNRDLLTTYNRWQHTQSGTLRKILEEEGINPVPFPNKDPQ